MKIRDRIIKLLDPDVMGREEVQALVQAEIKRAKAAIPISASYDPNGEGYRRMSGTYDRIRDLQGMTQDRMFEIAYYMFDNSAMTKRLGRMDKTFIFSEPIGIESSDDDVKEILARFWTENNLDLEFPDQMMWLSYLGEQCWPVTIAPANGHVTLGYVDPADIKDVYIDRTNPKIVLQVEMQGMGDRSGQRMAVIRKDNNPMSKTFGRLVGNCFFWAINHPPNSPRGRSDFLTLFDWIDAVERYGYNSFERSEGLLNYVWDVLLKGMDEEQIREWVRNNPPPSPGSIRAHNENVEWDAVSPTLQSADQTKGFDMGKSFIMGAHGRPDSWFGGGGKAYQTEAEQFGQVPIKDLDERQLYIKNILTVMLQFQLDQAVIAGRISDAKAAAGFDVILPPISKPETQKLLDGLPQAVTGLSVAEERKWIRRETAARIFAMLMQQFGSEIDPEEELKGIGPTPEPGEEDYLS